MGCGDMYWIEFRQDTENWREHVNVVMDFLVLYNAGNSLSSWRPVIFTERAVLHGVIE